MRFVRTGVLALVLVLGVGAAACSSDSSDESSGSTTTAPEEARTSDANVAAGLAEINTTATGIAAAAGTDKAEAQKLVEDIEPAWQPIEGTIKENSEDTYIAFKDAFAVLEKAAEDGDAASASQAAQDIATATASYLQDYPG